MSYFIDIFLIGSLFGIILYYFLDKKYSYWAKKGVPHEPPSSYFFGNIKEFFYLKVFSGNFHDRLYRKFSEEPYCGFYEFQDPVLIVKDPQLVETVLVKKFNNFHNNKFCASEQSDDLFYLNPFVTKGMAKWKDTRSIIASAITPNKVKLMEEIVKNVYPDMCKFIDDNADKIEIKDLTSRLASETVAMFSWGIRSYGFTSESTVKSAFDAMSYNASLITVIMMMFPTLARWLKLKLLSKTLTDFIKSVTLQTVQNIEKTNSTQPSIVQSILTYREKMRNNGKDIQLQDIYGQIATFYLDAYETVARMTGYILYSLALHPEVQDKLQQEILEFNEDLTMESISKLTYLEMVISEVQRLHPPVPYLGRNCTENCRLGDFEVEKGTDVIIPSLSLHYDPKYYPDPEKFNPENFSEKNIQNRHKFTFLPFGQGPRICPGVKYATTQMKLTIAHLLKDYNIVLPEGQTILPIKPGIKSQFLYIPDDKLYIKFKKRQN